MIILQKTILNFTFDRYLLLLLSYSFLYGQEPCIADGIPYDNVGILDNCDDGTTGCDCNNDCGGSAFLNSCDYCVGGDTSFAPGYGKDDCGVCGGSGPSVLCCDDDSYKCNIEDCPFCPDDCHAGTEGMVNYLGSENLCVPTEFSLVILSNQQAFYYFISAKVNGITLDSNDWIGAFNGDVCVGARNWNGTNTDVPVMGYSPSASETDGYCNPGDIPTFKIYDSSDNVYVVAKPSEDVPWIGDIINIDNLTFMPGCTVITACNYNPDVTEPDDGSCEYVADCTGECGGSALEDECGTCDSNSANDCVEDCAGTWGGSAYNQGCGCGEEGPSGCNNVCGSTLEFDACGVCGGSGIEEACDCIDTSGKNSYGCCDDEMPNANGECELLAIDTPIIPNNYSISNIYPNPFNPTTSIEYILPENTVVKLIVYNIHGRKLQTLVKGFKFAGHHSINWNASNYPSGVYLLKLEGSMHSKTQKVVLIK